MVRLNIELIFGVVFNSIMSTFNQFNEIYIILYVYCFSKNTFKCSYLAYMCIIYRWVVISSINVHLNLGTFSCWNKGYLFNWFCSNLIILPCIFVSKSIIFQSPHFFLLECRHHFCQTAAGAEVNLETAVYKMGKGFYL